MAAPVFNLNYRQDLAEPVRVRHGGELMFTGDALANKITVTVTKDGEDYTLGGTVSCKCIRADGATVAVTGASSGNTVSATLTSACYAVPGPLAVIMTVTGSGVTTTVLKAVYTVDLGSTSTTVDPGTIITDVTALINAIETAIGSIPSDYSSLLASIARNFSTETPFTKGEYAWYNGSLYRFKADHSAGTWNSSHVDTVVLADDITNLRTAIGVNGGDFNDFVATNRPYVLYRASYDNSPFPTNYCVGSLRVYEDAERNYLWQIFTEEYNGRVYTRLRRPNGNWDSWSLGDTNFIGATQTVDCNSLLQNGVYAIAVNNASISHLPVPDSVRQGILLVYRAVTSANAATSTYITYQIYIQSSTGAVYSRLYHNGEWRNWNGGSGGGGSGEGKSISILFVGNSLTQDGIAYVPYMLKTYFPEISFKFYIWYNGGFTLQKQYEDCFVPDVVGEKFSVAENTATWTTYENNSGSLAKKKMSEVLSSYTFDVVCMQDYFKDINDDDPQAPHYSTEKVIEDYNNCRDYIVENYTGGNGLEFITLIPAPNRNAVARIYGNTIKATIDTLHNTVCDDIIANGIAVYRALSTSLDDLGDNHHLCPAGDNTHTQEGLPCLLQTFTTLCWMLNKLGCAKGVYGSPMRMTTAIYNSINVPGPNLGTGVITGTDEQNALAQEVAIMAYKEGKSLAIDLSDEQIYDIAEERIVALESAVTSLRASMTALENELTYPKA